MSDRKGKAWGNGFGSFEELEFKQDETVPEVEVEVKAELETTIPVVEENFDDVVENLDEKWVRPKKNSREEVGRRAGGASQSKKAAQLLKEANQKDKAYKDEPIFEKAENLPENKKRTTKRKPKENLKEVDFSGADEIKVRMPNPEDLEGKVFLNEETESYVNSRELPDPNSIEEQVFFDESDQSNLEGKELDFSDPEHESKTLKTKDILAATSIDDLLQKVDASEGIQGSQEYFDAGQLRMIIEMVRNGELTIDYVTRSGRLRQKVFDLLEAEKTAEPSYDYLSEEEFVQPEKKDNLDVLPEILELADNETGVTEPKVEKTPKLFVGENEEENNLLVKKKEEEILEKRAKFVLASKEERKMEADLDEDLKNPIKKFLINGFGKGLKKRNAIKKVAKESSNEYHKSIDELIEAKTKQKYDYLLSLPPRSKERLSYGYATHEDFAEFLKDKSEEAKNAFKDFENTKVMMFGNFSGKNSLGEKYFDKKELESFKDRMFLKNINREIHNDIVELENSVIKRLLEE